MSESSKAVFLSYASQDAEAVQRICDALRAAGLEVWFDRNELRGGDAWDASIRKQIKECALFVPVISATTNARSEGYFRLEWKLAIDRSHLISDDQAFLLPVVIDDTPEAMARVPDRFRERQWSRLVGGETPASFAERVKAFLAGAVAPPPSDARSAPEGYALPKTRRAGELQAMGDKLSFFTELKRRNVYKVAIAYAVVAWLLIQIATQVFPFFEIPNWAVRLVVLAIVIGFSIALVIAWAFELTPKGLKRTEDVDLAATTQRARHRAWIFVVIIAGAMSLSLFFLGRVTAPSKQSGVNDVSSKSIAVLPFENLSEDKGNAYFVAGMQDEILTALAKISDLKVISRTSTAKYSSHPDNLKVIAEELGVAAILEASVQKAGEAVHITLQLISGHNDAHLWAESYDRELKNIFGVEREVAETVAAQLKAKLLPQEVTELARVPTTNPQAYDLYLRGKYVDQQFWNAQVDTNKPAVDFYRQAIALDPRFALAYASLANAQLKMYRGGEDRSAELVADAQANTEKSLALQPDLIEGHLAQAAIYAHVKHDDARALAEYESQLKRSPNDSMLNVVVAYAKGNAGNWQAGLTGMLRACELDPRNSQYLRWLAVVYTKLRRYAEADQTYEKALALTPDDWVARTDRALNLINQGKLADARETLTAWPDTKLKETALSLKYSTLQEIETLSRNYDAALAAGSRIPAMGNRIPTPDLSVGDIKKNTDIGFDSLYKGDAAGAHKAFTAAREGLESLRGGHLDDPGFYDAQALIDAGMDHREAAIEAARKAVALMPIEKNADLGSAYLLTLAQVYAHFSDADQAVPLLGQLVDFTSRSNNITPALLRLDPIWDPIRKDPRFQKLADSTAPQDSK